MIDGLNRIVLTLMAILLIAAGILALLAAIGVVAFTQPSELYVQLGTAVRGDPELWWPVLIGGAVIVALLAIWWALRQPMLRRPGEALSTVVLDRGDDRGRTTVEAAKVAQAAAIDLRRLPHVTASSARLVGRGQGRLLRTHIDVCADAELTSVRKAADEVYERVAGLLGTEELPTHTRIRPVATAPSARVR